MKLSREDWCRAGLAMLTEHGPEALKIDRLCLAMKVTKGSFYHYFAHREAFVAELLQYWQAHYTQAFIAALSPSDDAPTRAAQLSATVATADHRPEVALRSWARSDTAVAAAVAEVDAQRIEFLCQLLQEQGHPKPNALILGKLLYAHTLGCQQLGTQVSIAEWQTMDAWFAQWLNNERAPT